MSKALERLRTVAASDNDGGLGFDIEWAVKEIERLQAVVETLANVCGDQHPEWYPVTTVPGDGVVGMQVRVIID